MSDKEQEKEKAKRPLDGEGNDDEEKRSTRKKARVDYNEEKRGEVKAQETVKDEAEEDEEDDDEIQDVTPASIKAKSEDEPVRTTRNTSDDLMGLPMEPSGLEGACK